MRCWERISCGVLQHIHSIHVIESHAENGGESLCSNRYMPAPCDLEDFGRAINNWESIKVPNIKITVVKGHRRGHDVALAGRNIDDSGDVSRLRDLIQFAVVWFHCV